MCLKTFSDHTFTLLGRQPSSATAPPKGSGMQLGKSQKTNQFLESLKAEGELIVEDVKPKPGQAKAPTAPPTDPITLTAEEKLNVTLKRDGGMSNFDVQGTLSLQILNQEDGLIQVQVIVWNCVYSSPYFSQSHKVIMLSLKFNIPSSLFISSIEYIVFLPCFIFRFILCDNIFSN